jgi:hypothetical protein
MSKKWRLKEFKHRINNLIFRKISAQHFISTKLVNMEIYRSLSKEYKCILMLIRGGFRGGPRGRGLPFSPQIYHQMFVKLDI